MKKQYTWTPWYPALVRGNHYRARCPGKKIEECTSEKRNPNCTICKPLEKAALEASE